MEDVAGQIKQPEDEFGSVPQHARPHSEVPTGGEKVMDSTLKHNQFGGLTADQAHLLHLGLSEVVGAPA